VSHKINGFDAKIRTEKSNPGVASIEATGRVSIMKTINKFPAVVALAAFIGTGGIRAQASGLLYSQLSDGQSAYGPSELWAPAGVNSEVADDFDVIGNIDRVFASGFIWGAVNFQGVYVRFYQYGADGNPGALQREYFLNTGFNAGDIDVTLSPPFSATGRHFLSVQPVINYWYWWSSQSGAPRGQAFYFRDVAAGQTAWQHGDNLNLGPAATEVQLVIGSAETSSQPLLRGTTIRASPLSTRSTRASQVRRQHLRLPSR
jgi:hypothetical protein